MCRFITAVVPSGCDLRSSTLLDEYKMSFEEIRNPFVQAQLGADRYVRATKCVCDCDSALGFASRQQSAARAAEPDAGDIVKLRRKGWSQHRIDRWLAEKSGSREHRQEQDFGRHDAELKRWRGLVSSLLSDGIAKRLGLLLHTYTGTLEDEQFQIKRFEILMLSNQFENALLSMDEDVLYTVSDAAISLD